MTDDAKKWLSECNPEVWLLEEYKLLVAQYFHEDLQFKHVIKMFATIHIALFAFITSEFVDDHPFTPIAIASVGILLSIVWFGSMVRVREFRNFFEDRIKEIERALHAGWQHSGFTPLDLRTSKRWGLPREEENFVYRFFRRFETGKMYLMLPICSLAVWIILLIRHSFWPLAIGG